MNYRCETCNYETDIKSNLTRHNRSSTHIQLASVSRSLANNELNCIDHRSSV